MAEPSKSVHAELDMKREEFRIMELISWEDADKPVECRLHTFSFADSPPFTALSYVWGNPKVTKPIVVDGQKIQVTANLETALRHTPKHWASRFPNRDRHSLRIWADAVCINQANAKEKSHQVQLMRKIYAQAELDIGWLGVGDERMKLAMDTIITSAYAINHIASKDFSWLQRFPNLCRYNETNAIETHKPWDAVRDFLDLDFWYRAWIFQELTLSKTVILASSVKSCDFADIFTVCNWFSVLNSHFRKNPIPTKPIYLGDPEWRMLIDDVKLGNQSTINLITWARDELVANYQYAKFDKRWRLQSLAFHFKATNPLDYIYAFLGVSEVPIKPDYTKDIGEVYCQCMKAWLLYENNLNFLCSAGLNRYGQNSRGLPSWVPDWPGRSDNPDIDSVLSDKADKGFERTISNVVVPRRSLIVQGLEVSAIVRISPLSDKPVTGHQPKWAMADFILDYLTRHLLVKTGGHPLQVMFRVLLNRTPKSDDASIPNLALAFVMFLAQHLQLSISISTAEALEKLGFPPGDAFWEKFRDVFSLSADFDTLGLSNPTSAEFIQSESYKAALGFIWAKYDKFSRSHCFIELEKGHLGLAPKEATAGDIGAVLLGCWAPVIIRKIENGYVFIGDCFILGIMEGEVWDLFLKYELSVNSFVLR
jgi:hypothetical protein